MIRFPKPLEPGDLIAVTAPSSGVGEDELPRLDLVLEHLRHQGYQVVEGRCLRGERKGASAPRGRRAQELTRFLADPRIAAILPPWGGDLAIELLSPIDFEGLRSVAPKWFLGYSDLSTLQLPLTLISGWATAHGPNLMDLAPSQTDPLTTSALRIIGSKLSAPVVQYASTRHQVEWIDFRIRPNVPLNLTEPTVWRRLDGSPAGIGFSGRLIGGCLDTILHLVGSPYGDVPRFVHESGREGTILFLENAGMCPAALVRALWGLRLNGWFEGLSGLMLGRNSGPNPLNADALTYTDALQSVLADLPYPVLFDVDIGHRPPQFTLINGAFAHVAFEAQSGWISQTAQPETGQQTAER